MSLADLEMTEGAPLSTPDRSAFMREVKQNFGNSAVGTAKTLHRMALQVHVTLGKRIVAKSTGTVLRLSWHGPRRSIE
jgi:hypothetical protein